MDCLSGVYRPRKPKDSGWYQCVEDHFDEFVRHYDELFAAKFGFWRPHIEKIIYRFLDCGDLKQGFARIRCAWATLKSYLETACPDGKVSGAIVAIQTFGDLLSFHPHLHILVTDGCFQQEGEFTRAPFFDKDKIEKLFMRKVFSMLLAEGRLTKELIEMHSRWRHSGFHVFCGQPVTAADETSRENLARYIVRASLSQARLTYLEKEDKVVYRAKDSSAEKEFSALEWLAVICSHIPNPGEHMVRYYGYYSNVARGKRRKASAECESIVIHEPAASKKEFRRNWARLIQKIYEVDPLEYPKCGGAMRIISFIEEPPVIEKILRHLGLWFTASRAPPIKPFINTFQDDFTHYGPLFDGFTEEPDYGWDDYL
ncbi:transposase [Candidatus Riflebacteria bacterium]